MSFLAPLYVAGLLAVSLPILFHLIRRTPRGRQDFSSLMFLSPSPPRITQRSRLNNIVLLLLRAAALSLLAFAFARPFLRTDAASNLSQAPGRRIAIMVDTSASMRRGDLWRQATARAEETFSSLTPADEVALFFADRQVRPVMNFAEGNELDHPRRVAMLRARLAEASPTWDATRLGDALASVADQLAEGDAAKDGSGGTSPGAGRLLVLISDMQEGAHIDALQGHQWPESVLLDLKPVALDGASNAGLHLVADASDATDASPEGEPGPSRLRVRVSNQPDSTRDQFSLTWSDERGPIAGIEPVKAHVPPGRTQVVRVPWPSPDRPADRLVLAGDDADFDNTLYVVPPRKDFVRVVFLGDDAVDDTRGLRYYLESALAETPRRRAEIVARAGADPLSEPDLLGARLVVAAAPMAAGRVALLRHFAESGGDVLWILRDAAAEGLAALLGAGELSVDEAPPRDFALLGRVDTEHPMFAPFGESRFGDFTKIHFWKHRRVNVAGVPGVRVITAFDNGDPFLFEKPIGRGRVVVATSGWHPADSQLALSTKFVPLVDRLVRRDDGAEVRAQYAVHQPIALPNPAGASAPPKRSLRGPDGRQIELSTGATAFDETSQPGIYRLSTNDRDLLLAVNLAPDESRTAPLTVEELEQWGARLGNKPVSDDLADRQRQLQLMELENRQKLWRWLIVAVIGLLLAETALAGGLTRRAQSEQPQPEQVNS